MSGTSSFDASQVFRLATDLGKLANPVRASANVLVAVKQTAKQVQDGWNERLYDEGHASRTRGAITNDVSEEPFGVSAQIGAKRGSGHQAGIVRLLENGSIHNGPHGYGGAALDDATDDFLDRLNFAAWAATAEGLAQ